MGGERKGRRKEGKEGGQEEGRKLVLHKNQDFTNTRKTASLKSSLSKTHNFQTWIISESNAMKIKFFLLSLKISPDVSTKKTTERRRHYLPVTMATTSAMRHSDMTCILMYYNNEGTAPFQEDPHYLN